MTSNPPGKMTSDEIADTIIHLTKTDLTGTLAILAGNLSVIRKHGKPEDVRSARYAVQALQRELVEWI